MQNITLAICGAISLGAVFAGLWAYDLSQKRKIETDRQIEQGRLECSLQTDRFNKKWRPDGRTVISHYDAPSKNCFARITTSMEVLGSATSIDTIWEPYEGKKIATLATNQATSGLLPVGALISCTIDEDKPNPSQCKNVGAFDLYADVLMGNQPMPK